MGKAIIMERFGSLYGNMLDSLKMEWLNEKIIEMGFMSMVNINSIIISVLSLKKLVNLSAK